MSPQTEKRENLQIVDRTAKSCSGSAKELSARDYSQHFQERVCARFVATQSMKQTARDFAIPARVVSEILHLANFRRPVSVARSATASAAMDLRRTA